MTHPTFTTTSSRWNAIRTKDPQADGLFVYSVITTKIFCRPTCQGRLARRANVEFHTTPSEAEKAGYRPCKRCRPELIEPQISKTEISIEKIRKRLEDLPLKAPLPKLDDLAAEAGLAKHHFHRCFKRVVGVTPREYALSRRRDLMEQSRQFCSSTDSTPELVSHDSTSLPTPDSEDFNFSDWLVDLDDETPLIEPEGAQGVLCPLKDRPLIDESRMNTESELSGYPLE